MLTNAKGSCPPSHHSFEGPWLDTHAEIIRHLQLMWSFSIHTLKAASQSMKGKHEEWSVSSVEKLLIGSTCFTACSLAQKHKDPLHETCWFFPWVEVCVMLEVGWSFVELLSLFWRVFRILSTVSLGHPPENCRICWTTLCKFIDILVLALV